ncbi:helix-turn-helix domain-containing protein [Candidatus Epulonipiscium viviparus]|uniref:helix-turn-helix domain-containing protein n=1 Tax=Candidatus Epulonipiscium viviparus TaxID=420336 RepID=UPI00016BFDB2|nr:helix-turn-helix domain-containing protein [Candidatus Epulopiscium viviparus]
MEKKFFTIKEASMALGMEPYVLRYYEKELNLNIFRNSQKHRIFTQDNLNVIEEIKKLRNAGIELRAIKIKIGEGVCNSVSDLEELGVLDMGKGVAVVESQRVSSIQNDSIDELENKKHAFLQLIQQTIESSLITSQQIAKARIKDEIMAELSEELQEDIQKNVITYVDAQMQEIKQEQSVKNDKDENYYKRVDETIREMQNLKREVANLSAKQENKKKSIWENLFGRKNNSQNSMRM